MYCFFLSAHFLKNHDYNRFCWKNCQMSLNIQLRKNYFFHTICLFSDKIQSCQQIFKCLQRSDELWTNWLTVGPNVLCLLEVYVQIFQQVLDGLLSLIHFSVLTWVPYELISLATLQEKEILGCKVYHSFTWWTGPNSSWIRWSTL